MKPGKCLVEFPLVWRRRCFSSQPIMLITHYFGVADVRRHTPV